MSGSQSPSKSPSRQNTLQITKKDDMKAIFRNQVDSLKIIRQTLGEIQQLNKTSQMKYKSVKDNYEQQLPNFKKIRKDLDSIHKSIVKVLVCEERIGQIRKEKEEQQQKQQLINNNLENEYQKQDLQIVAQQKQQEFEEGMNQNRILLSEINLGSEVKQNEIESNDVKENIQIPPSIESDSNRIQQINNHQIQNEQEDNQKSQQPKNE